MATLLIGKIGKNLQLLLMVNWENWPELQLLCCVFSGVNKGVNWSTIQGMSVNIVRTEVKTDEYNDKYIQILIQIQQALWTENINTCAVSLYRSWGVKIWTSIAL